MKLIIRRDQKARTGLLGGHKGMSFQLTCRVELTAEEQELITKYKAEFHPLTFVTERDGSRRVKDTVASLTRGVTEEMDDISILLNSDTIYSLTAQFLNSLLSISQTFFSFSHVTDRQFISWNKVDHLVI